MSSNATFPFESSGLNRSSDAFDIDTLTEKQQIRLTQLLDEYLQALEQGNSFDCDAACKDEPALQHALQIYLEKLNSLYGLTDSDTQSVPPIPKSLGSFSLIREIGRGGMGIVYEATQAGMERRVALKLLPLAATLDSRQIARFKNESRAAGGLQHPNIVPVYSVGEADGVHFYAMQLIEGVSVDQWISDRRDSAIRCGDTNASGKSVACNGEWLSIVRWAIDIAEALQSAHETGVIHRDVKPSNLMVDREDKIWITDFGLARCQSNLSLTRSGDVIGTMRYMSPEQARGQSALVDGRTDIYSLAATVYEMLALQHAILGDDGATILKEIDEHNVLPLKQLCPFIPRDLETVIAKAMAKERDGRYETAEAFASDLRLALSGEPTVARPPTIIDRLARVASKHRQAALVSISVVALGFIGFAISTAKISATAKRLDESEHLARGAVDRLGSQMAELLAEIPAAETVRRQLLRETLDYYETFAERAGENPGLRQDLAITYGKIGSFQGQLGASSEAIGALLQSENLYRQLTEQAPSDSAILLDWSISQNNLADALHRAGRLEEAAQNFARAIRSQESLVADGSISSARGHLATSLNNLGLLLAETGSEKEAEQHYLQAVELLTPDAADETDPADRLQLASVLANLSGLLSEHDPKRAIEYARDALSNQTKMLMPDTGNAKLATEVVVTLNTLGSAQSRNNQNEDAITTFEQAIEIGDQLLTRWPDQPTYRRDLVISLNHLGLSLSKAGKLSEARDAFERALSNQRPLTIQFSSDPESHSILGGVLNNLGFLYKQLGDTKAALSSYAEAVQQQSVATRLAPEVERYRIYLEKHKHNLAEIEGSS